MKEHRHIGVYGVIILNDKILLIEKARGPYKGTWDLPGDSYFFPFYEKRDIELISKNSFCPILSSTLCPN